MKKTDLNNIFSFCNEAAENHATLRSISIDEISGREGEARRDYIMLTFRSAFNQTVKKKFRYFNEDEAKDIIKTCVVTFKTLDKIKDRDYVKQLERIFDIKLAKEPLENAGKIDIEKANAEKIYEKILSNRRGENKPYPEKIGDDLKEAGSRSDLTLAAIVKEHDEVGIYFWKERPEKNEAPNINKNATGKAKRQERVYFSYAYSNETTLKDILKYIIDNIGAERSEDGAANPAARFKPKMERSYGIKFKGKDSAGSAETLLLAIEKRQRKKLEKKVQHDFDEMKPGWRFLSISKTNSEHIIVSFSKKNAGIQPFFYSLGDNSEAEILSNVVKNMKMGHKMDFKKRYNIALKGSEDMQAKALQSVFGQYAKLIIEDPEAKAREIKKILYSDKGKEYRFSRIQVETDYLNLLFVKAREMSKDTRKVFSFPATTVEERLKAITAIVNNLRQDLGVRFTVYCNSFCKATAEMDNKEVINKLAEKIEERLSVKKYDGGIQGKEFR